MKQENPRIRFTKVREVVSPCRNNSTDAGIDFYVPTDLTENDFLSIEANRLSGIDPDFNFKLGPTGHVEIIYVRPGQRILIPSGIKVLIEPEYSMLQANNKSGISSKQGLIFSAEVVDSPYVGEVHIGVINTSGDMAQIIQAGKKLMQFIHVPVFLTVPEEISNVEYHSLAEDWGTRGTNGFGSSDNQ